MLSENERRKHWSTTSDPVLYKKFKELSKDTRIASSKLLDEAIENLLVKYKYLDKKQKRHP